MDRAWLEHRKATLQERHRQLSEQSRETIANIHACLGAIQLCDEQLAALDAASAPVLDLDALASSSTTAPDGVTLDVPPAGAA